MARREADVAIRKHYFEDTILIIGEFVIQGHNMNFVLKVSSFGSRSGGQNVQVYFGLLDDTMRDFSESRYVYDAEKIIVDRDSLLIRAENVEINESYQGLKVFVKDEAVTLDFILNNDGHKIDTRSLERLDMNNRVEGYVYPYCTTEGTALIGTTYCDIQGTAYYMRRFQNHAGRFDRRTGQTSILRGFSRNTEPETQGPEANSLYGFFVMADGKRVAFGSFGDGREQDDFFIVTQGINTYEHKIRPIQSSITDTGDEEHPDKDVTILINADDQEFTLKARRALTLSEDLSPEKKDFKLYDRFARLGGSWEGRKISGYGFMILT